MLTYRTILLAMLGMLIAAPSDAAPRQRRLFGRSAPACCPPQTYQAPAACAPAPCVPCAFVTVKCPLWYLGEYDSLHYHFAEIYSYENGICTYEYGDWLIDDEMLTCPVLCPSEDCKADVARTGLKDPTVPPDGEHSKFTGFSDKHIRRRFDRPVVFEGKVINVFHFEVDLNKDEGNTKWHTRPVLFGLHNKDATPKKGDEEVTRVKPLKTPNAYLVVDKYGDKFPILVNPK